MPSTSAILPYREVAENQSLLVNTPAYQIEFLVLAVQDENASTGRQRASARVLNDR